jgi:hypothetical protein
MGMDIKLLGKVGQRLPFSAAKATFALNAGECVLRDLFLIDAPDWRHESSPPSGRKSAHATVQLRRARSGVNARFSAMVSHFLFEAEF